MLDQSSEVDVKRFNATMICLIFISRLSAAGLLFHRFAFEP